MSWNKRILKSPGTWMAITIMLLCYFSASVELWNSSITEPVLAYRPSALIYSLEPILFGGVILVFPFCACLPVALQRSKEAVENGHKGRNVIHAFVAGGTVVMLPFVFHTVLWNIIALPINPAMYESHRLQFYGLLNEIYDVCYGVPVYCIFAAGMFLCGGVYAVMYLVASVRLRDTVVAFVSPALFYFGWLKLSTYCYELQVPAPVDLFNEGLTIRNGLVLVFIYMCILVLCTGLYSSAQRKVRES